MGLINTLHEYSFNYSLKIIEDRTLLQGGFSAFYSRIIKRDREYKIYHQIYSDFIFLMTTSEMTSKKKPI